MLPTTFSARGCFVRGHANRGRWTRARQTVGLIVGSTVALVVVSLAVVAPASADGHMEKPGGNAPARDDELPPQTEFFDELDSNADGAVTSDEFRGSAEAFHLLDVNKDGKITTTELGLPADYRPDPQAKAKRDAIRARQERGDRGNARDRIAIFLKRMDKNGDGKIERTEWTARAEMFDRLDQNKDGVIDTADRTTGARKPGGNKNGKGKGKGSDGKRAAAQADARFKRMDKNGDGSLSKDEMPRPDRLLRADKDGDGALSRDEFVAAAKQMANAARGKRRGLREAQLRRFDKDGDGQVTRDEFAGNDRMFKRFDANGDGVLSKDDMADAKQGRAKPDAGPGDAPKAPITESGSLIKAYDKDGDGKLNRAEFTGSNDDWKALDRDGDGWITPAEVGEGKK